MIKERPSILFVTIDCLRTDALSCYGGSVNTPNIDSIAAQGITYNWAISHGHFTKTAFAAIFSGTYPWKFGGSKRFIEERPHFVELLRAQGYKTLGVNSNSWLTNTFGYQRGYDIYKDFSSSTPIAHSLPVRIINNGLGVVGGGFIFPPYPAAEVITDVSLDLLKESATPFFLWIHYMDAHWPYNLSSPKLYGPWNKEFRTYNSRLARKTRSKPDLVSIREQQSLRKLYNSGVKRIDNQIGRLLREIDNQTVVLLTADHGEAFGEHGNYFHAPSLHVENIRVPLILRSPGIKQGHIENDLVRHIDIAPTIFELGSVPPDTNINGKSFLSKANGKKENFDLIAVSMINVHKKDLYWVSIRDSQWAAITLYQFGTGEIIKEFLYDYRDDPLEIIDLAKKHPDILQQLQNLSHNYFDKADLMEYKDDRNDIGEDDADLIERLKALGYMD